MSDAALRLLTMLGALAVLFTLWGLFSMARAWWYYSQLARRDREQERIERMLRAQMSDTVELDPSRPVEVQADMLGERDEHGRFVHKPTLAAVLRASYQPKDNDEGSPTK